MKINGRLNLTAHALVASVIDNMLEDDWDHLYITLNWVRYQLDQQTNADAFWGIYNVSLWETLHIQTWKILYTNKHPLTEGRIIIDWILESN